MGLSSSRVNFTGQNGQTLAARLERPKGPIVAYALFAHCFTCSKDIFAATRIARGLAEQGIATFRFDFTGLGHSEGDFANENFSSNVEDLVAAAGHMRDTLAAPTVLIGHSLGGAAVLAAAGQIPEVKAVATIGAPADPAHVSHLFDAHIDSIQAEGEAAVELFGRTFTVKKHFLEDIAEQKQKERIGTLKRALLVMHSPIDATVGIENAGTIFGAAKHPKSFISLDNADHLLSNHADAAYAADVLAAWAGRWVGRKAVERPVGKVGDGQVVVEESPGFKFRQVMAAGPHTLIADEPESFGGADSGPTPYGFLVAGLGACTSMTIRMYADRKGLPLDSVRVELEHAKIHAADCESCETADGKIDRIVRKVYLTGDLTADQRQSLLRIADKCPVHRTLHSEVLIETELSDP
ncbi:MAG: bifunctional alpha/beta hydrolase/OsmC family protein [Alphaproteobacteria bacterium]|nr:bifunctional alpha/beta hydrolase/OsmC family protein [Alphaproteobacteria bacterium]